MLGAMPYKDLFPRYVRVQGVESLQDPAEDETPPIIAVCRSHKHHTL